MIKKFREWIEKRKRAAAERKVVEALIGKIEQALEIELYSWQRLYIITGIWQPPNGRQDGRTLAYIVRLLLDQSKPLILYDFHTVRAYADNPFIEKQCIPVPQQYATWFKREVAAMEPRLRAAGVPIREVLYRRDALVISW